MAIYRTELILGALVMYPFLDTDKYEIYRVNSFLPYGVELEWREDGESRAVCAVSFDELIPIDITPEILRKNGFTEDSHGYWCYFKRLGLNTEFRVDYNIHDAWTSAKSQRKGQREQSCISWCKYLHQLQKTMFDARITTEVII